MSVRAVKAKEDMAVSPAPATVTPVLTGYATNVVLFASRYKQGGRMVYSLDLSLGQIEALITPPDPDAASPGNRAIRPAHADGFGKYIREREDWVAPGLLLRTPSTFDFDIREEVAGIQFGIVTLPRRALTDLHIIDGQHRILGVMRADKSLASDIDKARSNLATARKNEGAGSAGEKEARARIAALEKQRDRLENERISVQIHVESDPVKYKQMFFDIADNALGITASVKSRFDSRKVVHRALAPTMDHPLLLGRVDPEGDRISGNSPYMMGAKHVAEIIRTVNVGLDGRVSRRQEEEFNEQELSEKAKNFFSTLVEAFPQMRAISLGQLTTADLRKTSLLGSVLFVRVLGGAYRDLIDVHAWTRENVEAFFAKLAPHVSGPVYVGSVWEAQLPELFVPGSMAPRGRRQDLKALNEALVAWAMDKPAFLDAEPAPRPIVPDVEEEWAAEDPGYVDLGLDDPTKV